MTIEEKSVVDLISVTELGSVEVRRADIVLRDGEEIAKTYHRHVLMPGDDLSGQSAKVSAIAKAVWTPDVIEAHKALQNHSTEGELK